MLRSSTTVALFAVLALACAFGTHPDENGRYSPQFPQTPLNNQLCERHSGCVVSNKIDGDCCGDPCENSQAFNLSVHEKLLSHQEDICGDNDYTCAQAICANPTYTMVARCINQRCQALKEPTAPAP
jgi:hypothetical protein